MKGLHLMTVLRAGSNLGGLLLLPPCFEGRMGFTILHRLVEFTRPDSKDEHSLYFTSNVRLLYDAERV